MSVLWWNKTEPKGKWIFAKGMTGHGKRKEVRVGANGNSPRVKRDTESGKRNNLAIRLEGTSPLLLEQSERKEGCPVGTGWSYWRPF